MIGGTAVRLLHVTVSTFALATALWVSISPVIAQIADAPEAEPPTAATSFIGVPPEIAAGAANLVTQLEAAGASQEDLDAARAFLAFLSTNPDAFSKEVSSLSESELDRYASSLAYGANALKAIKPISEAIGNLGWLREADPQLAENIIRECGRRNVGALDLYAQASLVLSGDTSVDRVNLADAVGSAATECLENLKAYALRATELEANLNAQISELTVKINEARERGEDVTGLEAELAAAQQKLEEVKKGNDLAALLKILAGLASVAGAVIGMIATGGTCSAACYTAITAGAGAVIGGINDLEGQTVPIKSVVPATRPGINVAEPTQEAAEAAVKAIAQVPETFTYIPATGGGNFIVTKDVQSKNIVIFQIEPPLRITIDLAVAKPAPVTTESIATIEDLRAVNWTEVLDGFSVTPHSVSLQMTGTLGDVLIRVSFEQNPVTDPFIVTIQPG